MGLNESIILRPQPGAQEKFLSTPADIAVYGGAAGAGKSLALLLEPIRHINNSGFGAVIFRRESKELTMEGGLVSKAMNIYPYLGGVYRSQPTPSFTFPSGARISFGHLNQEREVLAWQGSEICYLAFDESNHFTDYQINYMMSRNRSTCGIRPYIRLSVNPDADSWIAEFLKWWIDQETGYPIKERGGVIRYLIRVDGQRIWGDNKEELVEQYGCDSLDAKSVTFIPATITDNPILLSKDPGYLANLKGLSFVERSRLLDGNWKIRPASGMYFPRYDTTIIDWVPTDVIKWVRSWDLAASEEQEGKNVDWTVGMKVGRRSNGKLVIADVVRVRRKAADVRALVRRIADMDGRETWIALPQDPGQSGKDQAQSYKEMLAGFVVLTRTITKNKLVMAEPAAALWQQGNIEIVRGKWNEDFLSEAEAFPEGRHDDQIDCLSASISRLPGHSVPDYSKSGLSAKFKEFRKRHKE